MEQNFQTSFIPKKPIDTGEYNPPTKKPVGLLVIISVFIFLAVALASLGLYLYKGTLKNNIVEMDKNLALAKERFEPAKINQLQVLGKRLEASNQILAKHIAVSPVFDILQQLTMKTIRYTKFSYEFGSEKDSKILIKMSGQAIGYRSIALQAELFSKNKNLIDPMFSNLTLDQKGNVLFDLEFSVDPSLVDYRQTLLSENNSSAENTQQNVLIQN